MIGNSGDLSPLAHLLATLIGTVLALAISVPPILWAQRRDMEDRMGLPKGALKRKNRNKRAG